MDLATVLSAAQALIALLQYRPFIEICTILGYKSELEKLQSTVSHVQAVLLDAEVKQLNEELSHEARLWIQELKDAVYDADDLLDEFVTLTQREQLVEERHFSKEVRILFSRFKRLAFAKKMHQGVKNITKKLDAIASNHSKFGLSLDCKPIRRRREETCSHMCDIIIGREEDVNEIVGRLLDPNNQAYLSFLPIVGMGGLGKTALAQLVYNDQRVRKEFSLKLWTCVSDQDQKQLDIKAILYKLLGKASSEKHDGLSMEVLQSQLRQKLAKNRYLLVLDDVWTENREKWRMLEGLLKGGKRGSWVVVTTRSKATARIVSDGAIHELNVLSDDHSWHLFQLMAFERMQDQANRNSHDDLVNIGRQIVRKCANVPLAIRVVGSFLYGQEKSKWLSFQEFGLANLRKSDDEVKPILLLSYHNLESPLKSCFSYCAVFPKDFEMKKEILISLWMAQGYIVPLDKGQSMEEAAEEYFVILLRRCFFQDVTKDIYGQILSCKMHDLMHDVALEVSEKEICATNSLIGFVEKMVRHVSVVGNGDCAQYSFTKTKVRTFLHDGMFSDSTRMVRFPVDKLLASFTCLRVLGLDRSGIKKLTGSIGELTHLRYLNLSENEIEKLPKSITKLYNLQTLILYKCERLKKLPKDLTKLVNLRVLDIHRCEVLACMPLGMAKLTCLHRLPKYLMGDGNSGEKLQDHLEGLKALKKLKGKIIIVIQFPNSATDVNSESRRGGAYLKNTENLTRIKIYCRHMEGTHGVSDQEEELLEELQPHPNLQGFGLNGYCAVRLPSWARGENLALSLPNLVVLDLSDCPELQCLPSLLGKLCHLKWLALENLPNLEYIENNLAAGASASGSMGESVSLFLCLEELYLVGLSKLKGWWRRSDTGTGYDESKEPHLSPSSPCFPQLIRLWIERCPNMVCNLLCPNVEVLKLYSFNTRVRIINKGREEREEATASSSSSFPSLLMSEPTKYSGLVKVEIDNVACLHSLLPAEDFRNLIELRIENDKEVENLAGVRQLFHSCSSSLRTLEIGKCPKLMSLSGGLEYLLALETLSLWEIPNLTLADPEIEGGHEGVGIPSPWRSLHQSLQWLLLWGLPQVFSNLPEGMQYLTSLQYLEIGGCPELQCLPTWMTNLTSLSRLEIRACSEALYQRCQRQTGEDWPSIQHIPNISAKTSWD